MAEVHPRAGKRKLEEECLATEGHGVEKPFQWRQGERPTSERVIQADPGERDLELGKRICASFMTQRGEEKDPLFLQLSHKAIEHFNSEHNTNYKFVEIVTLNTSPAAGIWCYITFLATDSDDSNASKTFQALVWRGINKKIEVRFCRLKKQGDKKTS
ncbi:hypothetical protein H5410_006798 [Solanum commersonii]|uniref:Cystatin domain-containing protein n=1 Tax=Solanum commersonii TaxID=4109 RepID=A0A9J6AB90_SOLCO|nr:hypothetical protein H5410_006798 [Solanum commersonii]